MEKGNILKKAEEIRATRGEEYGSAGEVHRRACLIASVLCNYDISPEDITRVQMAIKLARESMHHKEDNLVDLCGYASILNSALES